MIWRVAAILGLAVVALSTAASGVVTGHKADKQRWTLDASGARAAAQAQLQTFNAMGFESGNLGRVVKRSSTEYDLHMRSDNDDALPLFWRQWWYGKVEGLRTDRPVGFTLKGQGIWNLYMPAYSYDNVNWRLFTDQEVRKVSRYQIRFAKRFDQPTVYLARYVPYTYSKVQSWLEGLARSDSVTIGDIGTSQHGRKIPHLTISDPRVPLAKKSRVLLHARTHPGEVGSNFMLEGLVEYLLGRDKTAKELRRKLIVDIVPMLNVDGVVSGNNRVTPGGVNLEGKWHTLPGRPFLLDQARTPKEVRLLHAKFAALAKEPAKVTVALNLHSSAGEPGDQVFFFPHFGPRQLGYKPSEARLYASQMRFIDLWRNVQGRRWFNEPPRNGQRVFLPKEVPESWWWKNFQDKVMALSIESVYGRAGPNRRWVTPSDMRQMGRTLGKALARYHGIGR